MVLEPSNLFGYTNYLNPEPEPELASYNVPDLT
jgi:hypothetical protein